ncbi:hypothetical protein CEQ90_00965 [Lewinellaceae bacterium SD302]|nr:hypothetical protein CEQ90_00965 [Lewinellaceae bacterium SD302]
MGRKKKKKPVVQVEDTAPPAISSRYRFFLWMVSFFAVAALFIGLDIATVWPGAEALNLDLALSNERGDYIPAFTDSLLTEVGASLFEKADLFFLFPRVLSAIILITTAVIYYRWGQKLFGKQTVQLQLLLFAASLYLPLFGKIATADSLLILGQVGSWLSLIYLIRSGRTNHQFYLGLFTLLSSIADPVITLEMGIILISVFTLRYDYKVIFRQAWMLPVIPLLAMVVHGWNKELIYFGSGYLQNILYCLLGTLPFIGFVIGGLRDLVFKLKRREELAIILAAALFAGLASGSPLFGFALCAIGGKQLQLYFTPNYPWNNWVRGPAILHLIFALIGSFLLLLGGFVTFRGDGYRAFLGMVAAYWIFSLFAILGIYGMRRDFTIGGTVLSGVLATLFFWVQVYPYFETERNWPEELVELYQDQDLDYQTRPARRQVGRGSKVYVDREDELINNARPYFRRAEILGEDVKTSAYSLSARPGTDTTVVDDALELEGRSVGLLYRFMITDK